MSALRARRAAFAVISAFAGLFASGCGDPITVLGDNPNTMRIVAGVPDQGGKTAEAKATESLFSQPAGIVVDADGFMYMADSQNRRIVRVASDGDLTVVKDDGFCTGTCLVRPTGLALDSSGRLVVSDPGGNRIWTIDLGTGQAAVLAGTGEQETSPDGALANESPIAAPLGIVVGLDGTVYFAESAVNRVRRIGPGGVLGPLAGTGERSFSGDGGPRRAGDSGFSDRPRHVGEHRVLRRRRQRPDPCRRSLQRRDHDDRWKRSAGVLGRRWPGRVHIDRDQISRVFKNIVGNAIDAMTAAQTRELHVDTAIVDGYAEIRFADTGSGFSGDAERRVFEPYFTTKSHGMGLGMAISYRMVAEHGGEIVAENRSEGGARVTVRLPLTT